MWQALDSLHLLYCSSIRVSAALKNVLASRFVCVISSRPWLSRRRFPRLTSDDFMRCHTESERKNYDFCLNFSH